MKCLNRIVLALFAFTLYIFIIIPLIKVAVKWRGQESSRTIGVIWNLRTTLNLLSPEITPSNKLAINGWWMDHSQWKDSIECLPHKWSLCTRSLSSTCNPDKVRAVYQYVSLKQKVAVTGLDFSLNANCDISEENGRALLGAVILVKLNTSAFEMFKILISPPIDSRFEKSSSYEAPPHTIIVSVTVMLMCHGYSGVVQFYNIMLLPRFGINNSGIKKRNQLIDPCKGRNVNKKIHVYKKESLPLYYKTKTTTNQINEVTLTTHLSMDRLSILERTIGVWKGPVSLVIFVPRKGDDEDSDSEWQKIYVQKKLKDLLFWPQSQAFVVYGKIGELDYPINYLRNLALKNCETKFCFINDADFQPSPDFLSKFLIFLKTAKNTSKTAFVVPAFEYTELPLKRDNVPRTKEELMQLLHRKEPFIQPFRLTSSPESHRLTNYYKWYRASKPYVIRYFNDKYEPYLILQKTSSLPKFDESFSGYGMNKVTFITELYAAGYEFLVLPDIWIIHIPHKYTVYAMDFLQNPYHRLKNRFDRFEFVAQLMKKYKQCFY